MEVKIVMSQRYNHFCIEFLRLTFVIISICVIACISQNAYGMDYYVDAINGSDSAGDGSQGRPFQTIQKAANIMASGDHCLIRRGVYRETVTPKDSQTFEAYNGEFVLITGTEPITGWTLKSGSSSIYRATLTQRAREVFVEGARMNLARHPNEDGNMYNWDDWLSSNCQNTSTSGAGTADVSFSGMNQSSNYWSGGYYVGLHGHNFYQPNIGRIISSSGNRISITDLSSQLRRDNPEFEGEGRGYIINHINALDTAKEWYWGDNTLYLWMPSGINPNNQTVEAQVRLWGFNLSNRSNVVIKGLNFKAASVLMDGSQRCTIDSATFRYHSPFGTHYLGGYPGNPLDGYYGNPIDGTSGIYISGSNNTLKNSYIGHTWGQGVVLRGDSCTIENNLIEDTSWLLSGLGSALLLTGNDNTIKGNTIRQTSGMGICGVQIGTQLIKRPKILNNDISDTSKMLLDSGQAAMYISNGDISSSRRSLEGGIIAYNKIGRVNIFKNNNKGMGIYLDDGTDNATIHHNVINAGGGIKWAIFLHYNGHLDENIFVYNNTIWGYQDWAVWFAGNWDGRGGGISNCIVRNNIAQRSRYNGNTVSHNRENVPASEFVNAGAGDFRLNAGSPSINAGINIPGITDNATDGRPDLGAYEYGAPAWTAGSSITGDPGDGPVPTPTPGTPTPTPTATPTITPTPNPGCTLLLQAEQFNAKKGVNAVGDHLADTDGGDWIRFDNVNLNPAFTSLTARLAVPSSNAGGRVEIHLDSIDGPIIGSIITQSTGSWTTYSEQTVSLSNASGVHTLFITFHDRYGVGDFDWFRFSNASNCSNPTPTPTPTPTPELNYTIPLKGGWNLISLPIEPNDTDIADVLSPINGMYTAVHAWNGTSYDSYYPDPVSGALNKIVSGNGYWVLLKGSANLIVKGREASKDIQIKTGWNLVGYSSLIPMAVAQAIASAEGKFISIYEYDPESNQYKVPAMLQPGIGYWVESSSEFTWKIPN
jgi:hypothetical protein